MTHLHPEAVAAAVRWTPALAQTGCPAAQHLHGGARGAHHGDQEFLHAGESGEHIQRRLGHYTARRLGVSQLTRQR